jgi:hypothetical protein
MFVLGSGFCLFVSPDPGQQVLKVGAGELPLEGPGDPAMQTAFAWWGAGAG